MAYTTQANIEARLGKTLSAAQATYYTSVIQASVDEYINGLLGTSFGSTDSTNVLVDAPDDSSTLVIPTMHDVTAVTWVDSSGNEEVVPVNEYYTYPRGNANVYAIKRVNSQWNNGNDGGYYKITGEVGYKTVPSDITALATELAANALNTSSIQNYKSEKVGDWAVTYGEQSSDLSSESLTTIERYKRLSRSI